MRLTLAAKQLLQNVRDHSLDMMLRKNVMGWSFRRHVDEQDVPVHFATFSKTEFQNVIIYAN